MSRARSIAPSAWVSGRFLAIRQIEYSEATNANSSAAGPTTSPSREGRDRRIVSATRPEIMAATAA